MDWVEDESIRLLCPCLADVFIRCEAPQGLEPAAEVVGRDEVGEVTAQLVVGFVVVALDRGLLEGSVHALDLAVGPRVVGLGHAVLDAVGSADLVEAVDPIAGGPAIAVLRQVGELDAVIGEHGVKPVRYGSDQGFEEAHGGRPIGLLVQLDKGELGGSSIATKR